MYLKVAFLFISIIAGSLCEVTLEIKSKVALNNTYTSFLCAGYGTVELRIDLADDSSVLLYLNEIPYSHPEYEINVTKSQEEADGITIITINTTIFAEERNNKTNVSCTFSDSVKEKTGPATLYIAKDTLGEFKGFQNPSVSYVNREVITTSWSPPWSHPVNRYTVTVNNKTSSEWTEYNVNDGEIKWNLNATTSAYSDCHDIAMFVTAYTDIGSTKSNILISGFPLELKKVEENDVAIDLFQKQSGEITAQITVDAPPHCSNWQQLLYNYTLYADNSEVAQYGPLKEPRLAVEGIIQKLGNYSVSITYCDEKIPLDAITVTKAFYSNFTNLSNEVGTSATSADTASDTASDHQSTTPPTTSTDASADNTCITEKVTTDHKLVYITAASMAVGMFILLGVCSVLIIVILKVKRRVPRHSEDVTELECKQPTPNGSSTCSYAKSATTIKPAKKERKRSVPQMMATNPIYEGSAGLYAYLPDAENLKALEDRHNEQQPRHPNMSLEIPPQLPPPRKMSLDSPGIKSGIVLSLDKRSCLGIEESDYNDQDQYVAMRSASELRYAKSPVMRLKLEETSYGVKSTKAMDNKDECNLEKE